MRFSILLAAVLMTGPLEAARVGRAKPHKTAKSNQTQDIKTFVAKVNDAATTETVGPHSRGAAVLRAQILLDRVNFSVGEIDGGAGPVTERVVAAFQRSRNLRPTATVDADTWKALNEKEAPALIPYTITEEDVAGPFEKVPEDMMEKAQMKSLGYESSAELLGEKFHVSPRVLARLNPRKSLDKAGEEILVPNVEIGQAKHPASKLEIVKADRMLFTYDAQGQLLAAYPVTYGTDEHDPLPLGTWKVTGVFPNPAFHYNPELFWDADPTHAKAKIAPGPNNPVGVVWIDLSKEHYGIHGTPEPSTIGKTESHGCVRLTNWDAVELSHMVQKGVEVLMRE